MIPYTEFFYGSSTNFKLKPSSYTIKKTLHQQSLDILVSLTLNKNETSKTITKLFPTEDVITVTQLTRPLDTFGRDGIDNHTIILKTSDYLKQYPPLALVSHLFKPLEVKTKC